MTKTEFQTETIRGQSRKAALRLAVGTIGLALIAAQVPFWAAALGH